MKTTYYVISVKQAESTRSWSFCFCPAWDKNRKSSSSRFVCQWRAGTCGPEGGAEEGAWRAPAPPGWVLRGCDGSNEAGSVFCKCGEERESNLNLWWRQYSDVCASPFDVHLSSKLQIGERNWGREKLELLERLSQERAQWEQRLREATSQQGMVGVCVRVCN